MEIPDLVRAAKNGDAKAFGELYDQYARRIFIFILAKVQDRPQAEDILQEVFLKAWRGLDGLRFQQLNFSAWLYRIASNTINDHFRRHYRKPPTTELLDNMEIPAAEEKPSNEENLEAVRQAVDLLPEQYRQVLELRFFEDFSPAETAKILKRSNLAVRLLQHRALNKLRRQLNPDNVQS